MCCKDSPNCWNSFNDTPQIKAHRNKSNCTKDATTNPQSLEILSPECKFTHFFGPVSAVGAIATDPAGQVLLLIRAKDPGKGMYGLPGGFVDPGETAEAALQREVLEEVTLEVTSYHYLVSYPNEYNYRGFILPVTDLFFVVEVRSFDTMHLADGEISDWHFCHPTKRELKRMAFESNRRALEFFLKSR
jgi:NADH pyrophosphatase NudC (nudix superfamily)